MPKPSIKLAIMACLGAVLRLSLVVAAMVALLGDAFAGPNTSLPFGPDTFESATFGFYTNGTPLIDGTNGWYGSSAEIIVQTNTVKSGSGTNAAMLSVDCTLSNRFQSITPKDVWMQMDMRFTLYDATNYPTVDTSQAGVFYIDTGGYFVVHNGPTTNADSSTNWITATTNVKINPDGITWVPIGIYADFSRTNWDLYAKTNPALSTVWVLVTNNIGFVNQSLTNFAGFDIYNGSQTTYLDNVYVSAPGTVTVSPTNLYCNMMRGVTSNQSFNLAVETGIWNFTNTVSTSATWLTVNPVAGTVYAEESANVGVTYGSNQPVGSYTGIVTVSVTNGDGVPRTKTVTATLDIMDLQVGPTNLVLTNGFMYSNDLAISSQTFSVWNGGAGTFNYTAQPQGDATNWIRLIQTSNVAGSNTITLQYTNLLAPRDYTGTIEVASSEGGGATSYVYLAAHVVARPVLGLIPLVWTQTVIKGSNPINQAFSIWNGSVAPVVPMAYTLSNGTPDLIQSLSAMNGVSTGQANSVTINYMDVSWRGAGVYTAMVHVAARDAGTTYSPTGTVHLSNTVTVLLNIVALDAPLGVTASCGTFTNKVAVSWYPPVVDAVKYKVYRSETFDWTQVMEPIGESVGTNFDDSTGVAGKLYYYWVSSVNGLMAEGDKSTNRAPGYRALAAPGGIFATDGTYTNKIRVTWPLVDGATGYQLYRRNVNIGDELAPIYFVTNGEYDDMNVEGGVHYEYRVGTTNGAFGSTNLSVADIGYAFGVPGVLSASKGTYVRKVHLTWNAVESASGYQVWRGTHATILPSGSGVVMLGTVVTTNFDDTSVSAGVNYYYWVRGESLLAGIGNWSGRDYGYGVSAGADLWVDELVVLPVQVGLGGSPAIVSFRMGNGGETNIAGVNGYVSMQFFASTNQVFGAEGKISIGQVVDQITLGSGEDMVKMVDGGQLVLPVTEGDYNIFVQVLPVPPSLLVDVNLDNNVAMRNGSLRVRSSGGLIYHAFNDYDGDGMSDLGVYQGMKWSIRSVDERVLISEFNVFSGAGRPVLGDLDGDRYSDPMVYNSNNGLWQVLISGSGYTWASGYFGDSGYRGLVADYEGVGHGDASVFHEGNGRWYVLKTGGESIEWNWGEAGYEPVIGDYDGDGRWDLAVYQEATGLWYIRKLNESSFTSGSFGGPGYQPVPGDYDGDGYWDAALYHQATGQWYIISLQSGDFLAWEIGWGGPGLEPVMGDYDGDGKWDLGLYQEATGLWYIGSLDGRILALASHWGGPGYRPIGN